jgi:class 3 adenylate cyclase/tetratricopeptide (TPR) repeat protein
MTTCPGCGRENADDARFCSACGTALATTPLAEQRKVVTVLFCDVVGSTALGEASDPEALRARMSRYFDDLRRIVERHGGTVEKFVGDAVMAVFGIPASHEDDALRAVRAASEMRDAVSRHGLEARIGVDTGEVVVGGAAGTLVTGDAVNVAARLEQAAAPGEILLGAETRLLVRDAVVVETLEPLELKGKAQPVEASRLLEVSGGAAPIARRLEAPLVGRERERGRLWRDYEDAVADRACRLFTLLGPAGIGKSRLVADFVERIDGSADVLRGRCLSYGEGITYWPLVEMLVPLEIDPDTIIASTPQETRVSFRKLLEARAEERPQVVVVDDLQWAEPVFVDLVEHVADLSRGAPIFLLCIARTELLDGRPDWGGGKLNASSLLLEPLDAADCDALIDRLLGEAELDGRLRRRITDVSGGNALYVEEMVAMVRERDHAASFEVPPTIQALLQARLDLLADEERLVVGYAAVEGEVFHRGSLAELVPAGIAPELGGVLTALVRKELIRPEAALLPGEEAYRFRHLLIRDAAYGALPKELRSELHERLAAWLEGHAESAFELDEILGYHLEQAFRLRSELGSTGDEERALAQRAGAKLVAAGNGALARTDLAAAAALLLRGADLLPARYSVRLEALADAGSALSRRGELASAGELLRATLEEAEDAGDGPIEARVRLTLTGLHLRTNPEATSVDALREALEISKSLEGSGDLETQARARHYVGSFRFMTGRAAEGADDMHAAVELARRAGSTGVERDAKSSLLRPIAWGPLPAGDGIEFCDSLVRQEGSDPQLRAHALQVRAFLEALQGDFERSRSSASGALAILEEYGFTLQIGIYAVDVGLAYGLAGDDDTGIALLRRGDHLLEQAGETGVRATLTAVLAGALARSGADGQAEALTETSRSLASHDDLDAQGRWRAELARIRSRAGDHAGAEAIAREAVDVLRPTDLVPLQAGAQDALAAVLAAAGRQDEAAVALREAIALHERKGNVVSAARSRSALDGLGSARPS